MQSALCTLGVPLDEYAVTINLAPADLPKSGAPVSLDEEAPGKRESPTRVGDQHIVVRDAIFDVIFKGVPTTPRGPRRRIQKIGPVGHSAIDVDARVRV